MVNFSRRHIPFFGIALLSLLLGSNATSAHGQVPPNPSPQPPRQPNTPGTLPTGTPSQPPSKQGYSPDPQELEALLPPKAAPAVTVQGADLTGGQINAAFCPGQDAIAICVREIGSAQATVKVQTFQLLSFRVAQAMQEAVRRGVKVTLIVDESNMQAYEAGAKYLLMPNVLLFGDARHSSLGGNLIIVDDKTIITGAYRFDRVADERSATSVLVLKNLPRLASGYLQDFHLHVAHSRRYNIGAVNEIRPDPNQAAVPTDAKQRDSAATQYLAQLNAYAQRVTAASEKPQPIPRGLDVEKYELPPLVANQPWMEKYVGRSVELSFVVNKEGKAGRIEVLTTTGNKQLDEMAKTLVLQKTFPFVTDEEGRRVVYGFNHVFPVVPANSGTRSNGNPSSGTP